jgi:prevent-host-death family protein
MGSVGLRELRQDASDIIRRAEAGEEFDVTVQGRPAAKIVPLRNDRPTSMPGNRLVAALQQASLERDATGFAADIDEFRDSDVLADPWERQ